MVCVFFFGGGGGGGGRSLQSNPAARRARHVPQGWQSLLLCALQEGPELNWHSFSQRRPLHKEVANAALQMLIAIAARGSLEAVEDMTMR